MLHSTPLCSTLRHCAALCCAVLHCALIVLHCALTMLHCARLDDNPSQMFYSRSAWLRIRKELGTTTGEATFYYVGCTQVSQRYTSSPHQPSSTLSSCATLRRHHSHGSAHWYLSSLAPPPLQPNWLGCRQHFKLGPIWVTLTNCSLGPPSSLPSKGEEPWRAGRCLRLRLHYKSCLPKSTWCVPDCA